LGGAQRERVSLSGGAEAHGRLRAARSLWDRAEHLDRDLCGELLPRLAGASTLIVRWPSYRTVSSTSTFDITGIDAKVARLLAECPKK
jgi:predicted component of type VI protein secretion system